MKAESGAAAGGAETARVRSLFLDVVGFTKDRSVEAQTNVVASLNECVRDSLDAISIPPEQVVALPTGDGLCICLVDVTHPYDCSVLLALEILRRIRSSNDAQPDASRKFEVRIGINENIDNLVTDFNGKRNVAGAGISFAQRVMDKADGGQILVSFPVYETLRHRERYMTSFREYSARTKHNEVFSVYQYVQPVAAGLNVEPPTALRPREEKRAEARLTKLCATYLALCHHYRGELEARLKADHTAHYSAPVALFFIADDELKRARAQSFEEPFFRCEGGAEIGAVLAHYAEQSYWIVILAHNQIIEKHLASCSDCFKADSDGMTNYAVLSEGGLKRLEIEQPTLLKALGEGSWKPRIAK